MSPPGAAPVPPGPPIHQALHGYDHGHRLLASSRPIADDDLWLLDRLSDASGQRPVAGNDGYLTGYPLPSGKTYALARTWYAPSPPRPNVVWTHTLLVPDDALTGHRVSWLLTLHRRPSTSSRADLDRYFLPLPPAVPDAPHDTTDLDPEAATEVLTRLYSQAPGPAVLELDGLDERDRLCMAVWEQQWPRLRRAFSFCSGALEPRRGADRPFDLLLAPPGLLPGAGPAPQPPDALSGPALQALAADLLRPGGLRDFLRRCGPDSARLRIVPLLVQAYVMATAAEPPAAVLAAVTARAQKPQSMRLLKRALLDPRDGLLRAAPPDDVLRALLRPDVAGRLLEKDAAVHAWAELAWDANPAAVLAALRPGDLGPRRPGQPRPVAAARTAEAAAVDVLPRLVDTHARPDQLALLVGADPALAAHAVVSRGGPWWSAWAALRPDAFKRTLTSGLFDDPALLPRAVEATVVVHSDPDRYRALRDRSGASCVAALLSAKALSPRWADVAAEVPELLADALRQGLDASQAAAAADAAPDLDFVRQVGFDAFQPLAEASALWAARPRRAAVVFAAASAAASPSADTALGETYEWLYDQFQRHGADDAWSLLTSALPGKKDDWDRCQRLARGTADAVGGRSGPPRTEALLAIPPGRARERLLAELERRADRAEDHEWPRWEQLLRLLKPWW